MGRACGSILGSNRVGRHNAGVQRRWINLLPPAVTFLLGEVVGQQQREGFRRTTGTVADLRHPKRSRLPS